MLKLDTNGNWTWKPNSKPQETFCSLPDTIKEAFYGGAAGGGKSEVLLMLPIVRGWYLHPKFRGIIFRRKFPELQKSLIDRAVDYEKLGAEYNGTEHTYTFPSGAKMFFGFMQADKDAKSHDTNEYNYVAFDELTHFTDFQYRYLLSRARSSTQDLPAVVRSASNPGNIGHTWVRKRFIDPSPEGYTELVDRLSGLSRIFIPAKLTDNIDLMESTPEYAAQLDLLPEAERRAKKYGDWDAYAGQVFSEFRATRYPDEPENALHIIEPFEIPDWWPKILAIDWGKRAMTYALWVAVSPEGRYYAYREFSAVGQDIAVWSAQIGNTSQLDGNIAGIELDPSSNQDRGFGKTLKQLFIEHSGFSYVNDAINDRIGGKQQIHEALRWIPKVPLKRPQSDYSQEEADRILRIRGMEGLKEYNALFIPEPPEANIPKLQIFNNLSILIKTIPSCTYHETRKEDIAEFEGDDPIDTLRYAMYGIKRYVSAASDEQNKRRLYDAAVKKFAQTGDHAQLHRDLTVYEKQSPKVVPISLFHAARPRISGTIRSRAR